MLSWLKPHHHRLCNDGANNKEQEQLSKSIIKDNTLMQLLNGFIDYVKSIKFYDPILPPNQLSVKDQKKNVQIKENESQKDLQSQVNNEIIKKDDNKDKDDDKKDDDNKQQEDDNKDLFPKTINYEKDIFKGLTANPCSMTEKPANLLKFESVDGMINWKFDSDNNQIKDSKMAPQNISFSNLTSPFLASTGSTISSQSDISSGNKNINFFGNINSPSPTSQNQHLHVVNPVHQQQNNFFTTTIPTSSDLDSDHSLEDELSKIPELPNPEFFDIELHLQNQPPQQQLMQQQLKHHYYNNAHQESSQIVLNKDLTLNSPTLSDSSANSHPDMMKKSSKVYICEYCGSEFRIRGYLTRHIKKHAITKAYECPFFDAKSDSKCHPNGGFSRRDTYKTHLKARHFKYPPGTKSQDRTNTPGECGLCSKHYENNEEWVEKHIENGECEGLPKGFQIRIKNSRKKNYEFPNLNESPSSTHTDNSNNNTDHPDDLTNSPSGESSNNDTQSPLSTNSFNFLQPQHPHFQNQPIQVQQEQHHQQHYQQQQSQSQFEQHLQQQQYQQQSQQLQFQQHLYLQQQAQQEQSQQQQYQSNSNEVQLLNEQQNLTKKIILSSLQFTNDTTQIKSFEYDENDEYSLDVEQCSYRWPVQLSGTAGY